MCVTCGCGTTEGAKLSLHKNSAGQAPNAPHQHVHADGTRFTHIHLPADDPHEHLHADGTRHSHAPALDLLSVPGRDAHTMHLETQILGKNQLIAERNRSWLTERGILALNIVSSPGSGKTTLLERTLIDLKDELKIGVVEGDQATSNDAERIRATGVPAVQINTGTGCHLEADMLERAIALLKPEAGSLLIIENVGNLVCPALFDLGERAKVVIFSVTEGEDKPLKYPHMFGAAEVMLLSKIDLQPYVRFDVQKAISNALKVNPALKVFPVSSYSGEGLEAWYGWLRGELQNGLARPPPQASLAHAAA